MKDQQASSLHIQKTTSAAKAIIFTGLIAGILDGTAAVTHAFIVNGTTPQTVFQFVASKAFGPAAFSGGMPMVLIGVGFHFFIAYSWTLFFFWIYPKIHPFSKNKIITGIGYGLFVWLMMNLIVLPIVNSKFGPFSIQSFVGIFIHMCFVGLPISLGIHRYYSDRHINSQQ